MRALVWGWAVGGSGCEMGGSIYRLAISCHAMPCHVPLATLPTLELMQTSPMRRPEMAQ